ncbi:MAG TPA: hypothetical protein VJA20_04440 [Candidatus Nanoarchaeia archaeon]|nr:hypothetical protein [Candidatus Nanoarchaeia archaeon]
MTQKVLIFDSGSLISLSINGLLEELKKLKKIFNGEFIITKEVKKEVVDNPIKIKMYELEALKIQNLIDEGCLNMPDKIGITDKEITNLMFKLMNFANTMFIGNRNEIQLIQQGETSCLALSKILNEKKIKNVLVVDERTTRMLVEKPENLKELLEKKMHTNVKLKESNFKEFNGFKIIRSTELIYIAYKKGLINLRGKEVLDALLYALKFKGCAISSEEIEEIKNIK